MNVEAEWNHVTNPENVATNVAHIPALFDKHSIDDQTRKLNPDESDFSIYGMTLGRSKLAVQSGTHSNTRESKF